MNDVVIRILDTSNNVLGDLDLTNFTDFPLVLTKGIVNLDNLKARTGTYSKTFKVPNTKNNSKLLSNVDDINSRKDYRDALNRKQCVIIASGIQIDKGFVQISKVLEGFELASYELVFFGNNIDWVKGASELKLRDITYNNNVQEYTSTAINTVNSGDSDTYDHCYPYISKGGNELSNDTQVKDFYPSFYIRSIIERGLNDLGWNVSSSFLDLNSSISSPISTHIKRLACDLNPYFKLTDDEVSATLIRVEKTTPSTTIMSAGYLNRIVFNDDSVLPNRDNGSNYDPSTGIYTTPRSGEYNVTVFLDRFDRNSNPFNTARLVLVKNGDSVSSIGAGVELIEEPLFISGASPTDFGDRYFTFTVDLINGDEFSIYIEASSSNTQNISYSSGTFASLSVKSNIVEGDSYDLNNVIPKDITLLDVINDFTRMFNIYYWTDVKTKTIYLEPRDNFFESKTNALDWTNKLDIAKGYEVDYISSYKRNVEFKYKDLNNDEWLKGWQDVNKRIHARYNHVLPDRFAEGTNTVELGLFSAVYAHVANEATPLDGGVFNGNIVFTTIKIWNEYLTSGLPVEIINDYNPKIFLFNNGTQTSENGSSRKISLFGVESTTIPYGIFETYNNTTSDINLSFTGDDGLFSTYYSKMFKNIEEGGRLIAYLNLNSSDVDNLDFRKLVYIDRPSKVSGYYLIEQVIDFNPLTDSLTKVSLFKFENLGSVAIDETQEGNNSSGTDDSNTPTPLQPIYVEDGSNLIEVYIENPVTGLIEPVYR